MKTIASKKLKRRSTRGLKEELRALEETLSGIRRKKRELTDELADLRLMYGRALENKTDNVEYLKSEINEMEETITEVKEEYNETLETIAKIETILKTRTEKKATVGKVAGLLGLGTASLFLGYGFEKAGSLTNRAGLKFLDKINLPNFLNK